MGFRIHRGIFQKLNAERTAYENTFKIGDDGRIKEVDSEGEVVAGYLKVGEQATDADTVDGLHSGSFLRSDADDETTGGLRVNKNWGSGFYTAEAFTIRGTYPSLTLRSTTADNKWLFHSDASGKLQMYEGGGADNNTWDRHFEFDKSGNFTVVSGNITTVGTVFADVFSDRNNTSYYLDPANISYLNDLRPNIIYDRNDTNYYLNLNGDSKAYNFRTTGEFFAEQPAWGGFPLAPNLIHNSYMNKVTNGVPDGWSVLGDITIEAVSPWTKAFEGPYTAEAPANAVDNPEDATESNPYWFSRYYNGPRIGRGGMRSGWHSQGDGKILKVTGSGIVSPAHCAIYPPKEENNLGAKWLFSCFVKIVRGSAFKVGTDAGYRAVSGTQLASKAQTDAGPQGWIRVSGMLGTSQITRLDGLAMSLSIIPDAEGEIEGYIALPYLANATYKGTNYDSWSGSVIDKLARQGLYIHPSNGAVQVSSGTFTIDGNQVATQSWVGSQGYLTSVPSAYATTSYVDTAVSNLVDSAPGALNTLNELAAALGDDANFSTTVTNAIASKADSSHTHGIGDITNATRWWNNFGDNHTTRTSFDAQGSSLTTGFGWRYIQGNGNGPGTDSSPNQFYGLTVGLGNDYNYDNYGMQLVIPRNTATPYISVRFEEGRLLGAWQKISAGYADSAGSVAWSNVSGKPSTFAPSSHNHNDIYYTETEVDNLIGTRAPSSHTHAFIKPYREYGSYIRSSDTPLTLKTEMGGGGLRVDFMNGASFNTWSHVITWSGYDGYNMYQLAGNYGGSAGTAPDLYVRTEPNHARNSWSDWKKLWSESHFSGTEITNWNTAYGWGNHASAGYLTSLPSHTHSYNDLNDLPTIPSNNNQLTNGAGYITGSGSTSGYAGQLSDRGGYGNNSFSFNQESGTFAGYTGWANYFVGNHGDGATYYNTTHIMPFWGVPKYSRLEGGTFRGPWTYWTTENMSQATVDTWNTAYGWGNHATAGYVTSVTAALGYTPYEESTALSTTSISATDKISLTGGHSSARMVIKYNHEGNDASENSGNLVMWTSEPGISYPGSGIGGNVHESGHYYGKRNTNIPYGVALRFNVTSGRAEFQTTSSTNNGSFRVGWYMDSNGNTVQQGSITAPGYNNGNWDTAYGWGNHASAGYLTSVPNLAASKITSGTFANARISQSSVTQHQSALSIAASQVSGLPASAAPVATTVEGGEDSTLASIHFNPDEGAATFTLANGSTYRLAFAR